MSLLIVGIQVLERQKQIGRNITENEVLMEEEMSWKCARYTLSALTVILKNSETHKSHPTKQKLSEMVLELLVM